jgi:hypothetical protein
VKKRRLTTQKHVAAEKQRQVIVEQRAQREQRKKTKYESDTCEGKSARYHPVDKLRPSILSQAIPLWLSQRCQGLKISISTAA